MIDPSGFRIGDLKHKVLSLKSLPEATYSCMGALLQQLPFGSRLFFTVKVPDQTKEIDYLKTQRRITYSLARGKREGAHDIESEAKLQDLETLIDQLVSSGEKVFHVSLNVLIKGKDDDELEDQVNQVLTAIRQLSGAEAMVETVAGFSVFSEIAIPNARAKERIKRLKTSNLADMLPLYGSWAGSKSPSLLFRSNQNTLLKFDVFDSQNSNYNQLISGGSGSGKSFLCNLILMQMLKENPQVFFVDIGGSYKKLSENLNGQYVPLSLDDTISLNPFDLAVGEQTVSSSKIKFLLGLVELMTKEDGDNRLPKLERAVIEKAIEELYREYKEPRLSNLRDLLLKDSDPEIQKLGKILSPWCGDTLFGKFLDRKTNIELNKPLVAFDLKGLESYPELQAVCLFLITDLVWREVQRNPGMKKFLVFDECWKLLKNESGIIFIEEVFRTFRKYNASAIAISQDIDDFAKSKISKALLSNCSIKWLLMQQQIDEVSLRSALGLNDCEINILRSLHQVRGHYSQVLLLAQKDRAVCKVESTPLEYWLATTDPRDLGELSRLASEKPKLSNFGRLKELAEKYPFGMSGQQKEASA
jgi:conjugal transfer ATP-binding protein TraC